MIKTLIPLFILLFQIPLMAFDVSDDELRLKIDSLNTLSWKVKQTDLTQAYQLAIKAQFLSNQINYDNGILYSSKNLSAYYIFKGAYDSALEKAQDFLSKATDLNRRNEISNAFNLIGSINYYQGELGIAIDYYLKALEIKEEFSDLSGVAIIYNNISNIYFDEENYPKSLEYNLKSIIIKGQLKDTIGLVNSYNNIGLAYRKLNKLDSALFYCSLGLEIIKSSKEYLLTSNLYSSIAAIYFEKEALDLALDAYLKSVAISKKTDNKRTIIYAYLGVGKVYAAKGMYDKSLPYLELSNQIAHEINTKKEIMDSYEALAFAYASEDDYLKAYENYLNFMAYKDSLINSNTIRSINELEQKYELDKQKNQIRLLEVENDFRSKLFLRQRVIGVVMIFVMAIIGRLAFLSNKSAKARQAAIEELKYKNEEIIAKNTEIEEHQVNIENQNDILDAKNKKLIELDNEKNHLVSVVAHDLRSPLSNIIGLVGLINMGNKNLTDEQKMYMSKINKSAEKLNDMIATVLNKNNIESGALEINMEQSDINTIIEKVIVGLEQEANTKNLKVNFTPNPNLPYVNLDVNYADLALTNLLSNAIKFSPLGLNIFIEVIQIEKNIEIHVRDEGPGISQEDIPKLFGRYQRLSARPTAGEPSSGLGLSIVKEYMEAMHGRVSYDGNSEKGADFVLTFNL